MTDNSKNRASSIRKKSYQEDMNHSGLGPKFTTTNSSNTFEVESNLCQTSDHIEEEDRDSPINKRRISICD